MPCRTVIAEMALFYIAKQSLDTVKGVMGA